MLIEIVHILYSEAHFLIETCSLYSIWYRLSPRQKHCVCTTHLSLLLTVLLSFLFCCVLLSSVFIFLFSLSVICSFRARKIPKKYFTSLYLTHTFCKNLLMHWSSPNLEATARYNWLRGKGNWLTWSGALQLWSGENLPSWVLSIEVRTQNAR